MKLTSALFLVLSFFGGAGLVANANANIKQDDDTTPSIVKGASVYLGRCSLCHGTQGMGEGKIPLKIPSYPNTSLVKPDKAKTLKEIFNTVVYGSMLDNISQFMPPMGNELTWTELESVSLFVALLRSQPKDALTLLATSEQPLSTRSNLGKETYEARCVLCHGKDGLGDGRMARIITTPPPFNLTLSGVPRFYVTDIVRKGGEQMGRSPQMPPWGDQFSEQELSAVVDYVLSLRKSQ